MRSISIILLYLFFIENIASQIEIDGIPRDTSFTVYSTYIKESKKRPYIRIVKPNLPNNVKGVEGVIYSKPSPDRTLRANVYRPKDNKRYPALLMIHGGGWSSGDLSLQVPMAQQIASKGYVTIPVEYRLSPEAIYPAAVQDLKTAIRWVKAKAEEFGVDTMRIAVSGCSAGGQLATLIGVTNGLTSYDYNKVEYIDYSSSVQAVINIDGVSDFTTVESLNGVKESLAKNKISASVRWLGGTYEEATKVWEEASPIYWVNKHSAPICFINSSIDRFHGGRDEIREKLAAYDIQTEVYSLPDTPHPFWLLDPWFVTTVEYMTAYLDKVFK